MKGMTICVSAALVLLAVFSSPAEPATGFKIRFGILERDKAGTVSLSEETTNIPCILKTTGFRFGCEITPPDKNAYTYQTITHLPALPRMVGGAFVETNQIPAQDIPSKVANISGGNIFDPMFFDEGDPVGEYRIDIYINGKFVKTIVFNVRKV